MPDQSAQERQPLLSLIYLILITAAGGVVFTVIAYGIGILVYGPQIIGESAAALTGNDGRGINFLKMVQMASTAGLFIFPALIFARIESNSPYSFLKLNTPVKPSLILLGTVLMFASSPLLELTVSLNKQMQLPDFLAGLESWMRQNEDKLEKLTIKLLQTNTISDFWINMVMIALLPAIGEELLFRGCLQRIIAKSIKNYHVAIWVAAAIFSAIHMQFYGFVPRMLLGALFGYLLVWSNSIWIPILAHFINNATTVIISYVYQLQGKSLEKLVNEETYGGNLILYVFSFILTAVLLRYFYIKTTEHQQDYGKTVD